jgi:putative hemolysin
VVTNEYGGIEGVVTPADILKAIAGEMPEMGSRDTASSVQREDGSWLMDGHVSVQDAERVLQRRDLARDDYNTMAGFMLWHLGRLPVAGEKLAWRDLTLEVVDMDGLMIDKIIVHSRTAQALHAGSVTKDRR